MKCYKLLKKNKYYHKDNIQDFDMSKLKDAIGIQVSSLGAMGAGGLIYVITKDKEEILFDYLSSYKKGDTNYFVNSPVYNIVKEHLPILNGNSSDNQELIYKRMGWSFYIKKDYVNKFYKECEKLIKTDEHYKHLESSGISKDEIIKEYIVINIGVEVLFDSLNL